MNINDVSKARGSIKLLEKLYFSDQQNVLSCTDQLVDILNHFPALKKDQEVRENLLHLTEGIYSMKDSLPLEKQEKITSLFYKIHNLEPTRIKNLLKKNDPAKSLTYDKELQAVIEGDQKYPVPVNLLRDEKMPCKDYFKSILVEVADGSRVEISLGLLAHFSEKIGLIMEQKKESEIIVMEWINLHELDSLMAFLETSKPALINEKNALSLMYAGAYWQIPELMEATKRYVFSSMDEKSIVFLLNTLEEKKNETIIYQIEKRLSLMISSALVQERMPQVFLEKMAYFCRHLKHPVTLSLSGTEIAAEDLKYLKGFPLKKLELLNCQKLTPGAFSIIESIPSIKTLKLGGNQWVNDEALAKVPTQIEDLSLTACPNFTKNGLKNLKHSNVIRLDITGCNQLKDADFTQLPEFESIDLRLCKGVGEKTVKRLGQMALLRHLVLANTPIKDKSVAHLPKDLLHLNLAGCDLTDGVVKEIAKMKDLKELSLAGSKITDEGLSLLPESLVWLSLDNCLEITNVGIESLANRKNLKNVSLLGCTNIMRSSVEKLTVKHIVVGWQEPQASHVPMSAFKT
jgi:Leucine Rich repeat